MHCPQQGFGCLLGFKRYNKEGVQICYLLEVFNCVSVSVCVSVNTKRKTVLEKFINSLTFPFNKLYLLGLTLQEQWFSTCGS